MNLLKKAREALAALQAKIKALMEKDSATPEELAELKKLTGEAKEKKAYIAELEEAEKAAAAEAVQADPADEPTPAATRTARIEVTQPSNGYSRRQNEAHAAIGLIAMAAVAVHNKSFESIGAALTKFGHTQLVKELGLGPDGRAPLQIHGKSLMVGSATAGGILVPERLSNEIIPLLRPTTAFIAGDPREIPMPNGTFRQPAGATGATAAYRGELQNAVVTEPTFKDISMSVKELALLVPMSNQFLDFSIDGARAFVEDDMRKAGSEKMDNMAFLGTGVNGTPLGLFNISGIYTTAATNSTTPTIANVTADARKLLNSFTTTNLSLIGAKWVMTPKAFGYLQDLRDANSNLAWPSLQGDNPTWYGKPVLVTTNLPENLGGGGNEGYVALISFPNIYFGNQKTFELAVSTEAAYYDAGGVVRSAFQRGETLLLGLMRHDFAARYPRAVAYLSAVKWGQ